MPENEQLTAKEMASNQTHGRRSNSSWAFILGKTKKTQWFNEILIFKNAKKIKFMEIELNSQAGRIVYLYLTFNMNTMVNSIMGCYAIPKLY